MQPAEVSVESEGLRLDIVVTPDTLMPGRFQFMVRIYSASDGGVERMMSWALLPDNDFRYMFLRADGTAELPYRQRSSTLLYLWERAAEECSKECHLFKLELRSLGILLQGYLSVCDAFGRDEADYWIGSVAGLMALSAASALSA